MEVIKKEFIKKDEEKGYAVYKEEWVDIFGDSYIHEVARSLIDDSFIGKEASAIKLYNKFGIHQQAIEPGKTASIGFSKRNNKWYGWSHRAIYGFTVGSTCKKGDCHYIPRTPKELYDEYEGDKSSVEMTENGIRIEHKRVNYTTEDPETGALGNPIPAESEFQIIECGKGEWVAETMEDAKQMAVDFARSVS